MTSYVSYKLRIETALDAIDTGVLAHIIHVLDSVEMENKVIVCGNGGSFANAQHFAQDLQKMCGITAVALGSNPSFLSAVSNDMKYSDAFREELSSIVTEGDVVVILSCSGNSKNVVKVAKYMNENDCGYTIALTGGFKKMKIEKHADTVLKVNSEDYGVIESVHSVILHYLVKLLSGDRDELVS